MFQCIRAVLGLIVALGCAGGCGLYMPYRSVEREAEQLFGAALRDVQADQEARWREQPAATAPVVDRDEQIRRELARKFPDLKSLRLTDALLIATRFNREYDNERDANVSAALSLMSARHKFDPRLKASVKAITKDNRSWDDTLGKYVLVETHTARGTFGVDYKTALGTELALEFSTWDTHDALGNDDDSRGARASLSITQPLLKGAGRRVVREPLTQAQRSLVYRLRSFELFRQEFAVRTTRKYYDLVAQKQVIDNTRRRFTQADFLHRRAQTLFEISRVPEIDVFQAEQQRLQAQNDLRDAAETYKDDLALFKTLLGIPQEVEIDVPADVRLPMHPTQMAPTEAVQLAYRNRLDLATAQDRVADERRGVRIARNALLPDLTLTASFTSSSDDGIISRYTIDDNRASSAQLALSFPLDRLSQHSALRRAYLSRDEIERSLALKRDTIATEVRTQLRNLTRIEQSMIIQRKIVETAGKRLQMAHYRFRIGERTSREVVEAEGDLLEARNRSVRFVVDHAVAEMQLQRSLGTLRVGADGVPLAEQEPEKKQ